MQQTPRQLRFGEKFGIVRRKKNDFNPTRFTEAIKKFQKTESVQDGIKKNSDVSERDSTFCQEVFEAAAKSPTISVKRLTNALNASKSKVY